MSVPLPWPCRTRGPRPLLLQCILSVLITTCTCELVGGLVWLHACAAWCPHLAGPFYFGNVKSIVNWTASTSPLLFPNGLPAFAKARLATMGCPAPRSWVGVLVRREFALGPLL